MIQLYKFNLSRFYCLFLLTLYSTLVHYAFTHLSFYGFIVFSCSRCLRNNIYPFTVLRVYGKFCKFTKFTVLRSESGMLRLQIYEFTVLPFYSAPWQKTCLRPAPCAQTPSSADSKVSQPKFHHEPLNIIEYH